MGAIVRNVYHQDGRWKFRKVILAKLRPHIDGNPREFVRSLGPGGKLPPPDILANYAKISVECDAMLALATKRAAGAFDDLDAETVAYIIADERHHMLHEDEEDRFDGEAEALFETIAKELEGVEGAIINRDPDRAWAKRQESAEGALELWRHEFARGQISPFLTEELQDICVGRGLNVDVGGLGFRRLARAYLTMLIEVAEATLDRQRGIIVPTPEPPLDSPSQALDRKQTISGLVDLWWAEAKAAGRFESTYDANERAARYLAEFLGHDDANAVTTEDVLRFKDKRIASGVNLKTVRDSDLASLRVLFGWAKRNRKTAHNPVEGVTVPKPKRMVTRDKSFTAEEVIAILNHAESHRRRPTEGYKMALAKRWVPWLCAYTGARVGEMVQLRKQDVAYERGRWIIIITPDAGTTKTSEFRKVPIHPHLIELGILELVERSEEGPLFLKPTRPGDTGIKGATRTVKNRVTEFVREVVKDKRVQPNHGWRHRFETTARNLGAREDVTNWITGHKMGGTPAQYGETELEAMELVINRLPRYAAVMLDNVSDKSTK